MRSHNSTMHKAENKYGKLQQLMFKRQTKARKILMEKILRNSSNQQDFQAARLQWSGIEYMQDLSCQSECQCTKQDIKRLWVIYNNKTNTTMKWIGNCCVKHFKIRLTCKRHKRNVKANNNYTIEEMFARIREKNNNEDTNSMIYIA